MRPPTSRRRSSATSRRRCEAPRRRRGPDRRVGGDPRGLRRAVAAAVERRHDRRRRARHRSQAGTRLARGRHGRRRQPARGGGGPRGAARGRLRGRRRGRGAGGAGPGRTAVLGHRRRRLPRALRRGYGRCDHLRWARGRAAGRDARHVPGRVGQAADLPGGGALGPRRGRARCHRDAGRGAPRVRSAAVVAALAAGHPARRARLPRVAAPQ